MPGKDSYARWSTRGGRLCGSTDRYLPPRAPRNRATSCAAPTRSCSPAFAGSGTESPAARRAGSRSPARARGWTVEECEPCRCDGMVALQTRSHKAELTFPLQSSQFVTDALPLEGIGRLHEHRAAVRQQPLSFIEKTEIAISNVERRLPVHPVAVERREREIAIAWRDCGGVQPGGPVDVAALRHDAR